MTWKAAVLGAGQSARSVAVSHARAVLARGARAGPAISAAPFLPAQRPCVRNFMTSKPNINVEMPFDLGMWK
jgi:hypothetical protein